MDGHSSGAPVAGRLVATYPDSGAETRLRAETRHAAPIRSCSRWGLPCRRRYRRRGALLPHPFTLTFDSHQQELLAPKGGLLSVALSLGSPPPGVTRHRVPVEPGLSSPCRFPICKRQPSDRLAFEMWSPLTPWSSKTKRLTRNTHKHMTKITE